MSRTISHRPARHLPGALLPFDWRWRRTMHGGMIASPRQCGEWADERYPSGTRQAGRKIDAERRQWKRAERARFVRFEDRAWNGPVDAVDSVWHSRMSDDAMNTMYDEMFDDAMFGDAAHVTHVYSRGDGFYYGTLTDTTYDMVEYEFNGYRKWIMADLVELF